MIPIKMFLCSKLCNLSRVEISRLFPRVLFAKNVCWNSANLLVLVLRFLCCIHNVCRDVISETCVAGKATTAASIFSEHVFADVSASRIFMFLC
jgi:hypothetical protein